MVINLNSLKLTDDYMFMITTGSAWGADRQ